MADDAYADWKGEAILQRMGLSGKWSTDSITINLRTTYLTYMHDLGKPIQNKKYKEPLKRLRAKQLKLFISCFQKATEDDRGSESYLLKAQELYSAHVSRSAENTAVAEQGETSTTHLDSAHEPQHGHEGEMVGRPAKRRRQSPVPAVPVVPDFSAVPAVPAVSLTSALMKVFGQRLGDVIGIWDADAQARDSEQLVGLQRDFLDLSKARGTAHKDLATVQMMLHALADGALERYYLLLLGMVLQVYPSSAWEEAHSRLPHIIRLRLAFILRAWAGSGLAQEDRIRLDFPVQGTRTEQINCVKQWYGLVSAFEQAANTCRLSHHPAMGPQTLVALEWDRAGEGELHHYFLQHFDNGGQPGHSVQKLRQLIQLEGVSYQFDRQWLAGLLVELQQASDDMLSGLQQRVAALEADAARYRAHIQQEEGSRQEGERQRAERVRRARDLIRQLRESAGGPADETQTPEPTDEEELCPLLEKLGSDVARRIEAFTMQNAQYQSDLTRLQGIQADMISRLKAAAEMDAVFGSLEAVERQENEAELFSAAAAERSLEEENLLALATALPKQLGDQRCKLEQLEAELSESKSRLQDERARGDQLQVEIQRRQEVAHRVETELSESERCLQNERARGEQLQLEINRYREAAHRVETELSERERRLQNERERGDQLQVEIQRQQEAAHRVEKSPADGNTDWVRERMKPLLAALHASLAERLGTQPKVFGWDTLPIGSCEQFQLFFHEKPEQFHDHLQQVMEMLSVAERQRASGEAEMRVANENANQEVCRLGEERQRWKQECIDLHSQREQLRQTVQTLNQNAERLVHDNRELSTKLATQGPRGVTPAEQARLQWIELYLGWLLHDPLSAHFQELASEENDRLLDAWRSQLREAQLPCLPMAKRMAALHPDKSAMDGSVKQDYAAVFRSGRVLQKGLEDKASEPDLAVLTANFAPYDRIITRIIQANGELAKLRQNQTIGVRKYEEMIAKSAREADAALAKATEMDRYLTLERAATTKLKNSEQAIQKECADQRAVLDGARGLLMEYGRGSGDALVGDLRQTMQLSCEVAHRAAQLWAHSLDQLEKRASLAACALPPEPMGHLRKADVTSPNLPLQEYEVLCAQVDAAEATKQAASAQDEALYAVLRAVALGLRPPWSDLGDLLAKADLQCSSMAKLLRGAFCGTDGMPALGVFSGAPETTAPFLRYEPILRELLRAQMNPASPAEPELADAEPEHADAEPEHADAEPEHAGAEPDPCLDVELDPCLDAKQSDCVELGVARSPVSMAGALQMQEQAAFDLLRIFTQSHGTRVVSVELLEQADLCCTRMMMMVQIAGIDMTEDAKYLLVPEFTDRYRALEPLFSQLVALVSERDLERNRPVRPISWSPSHSQHDRRARAAEIESTFMEINACRVLQDSVRRRPLSWPVRATIQEWKPPKAQEDPFVVTTDQGRLRIKSLARISKTYLVSLYNEESDQTLQMSMSALLSKVEPRVAEANATALYGFHVHRGDASIPLHPSVNFQACALASPLSKQPTLRRPLHASFSVTFRDGTSSPRVPASKMDRWGAHVVDAVNQQYRAAMNAQSGTRS